MATNMLLNHTGLGIDMVHTENEDLHCSGGLTIPHEVADGITKATLKDWRDYLQSELDLWEANPRNEMNPDGVWMHPDDVVGNKKYIMACNLIIDAFGG